MSETTDTEIIKSPRGRSTAAYIVLVLCWLTIGWLIYQGDGNSDLHKTALSWAFWLQVVILATSAIPVAELVELFKASRK